MDYAEAIREELEELDMHFHLRQMDDAVMFILPMSAKNVPGLNVNLKIGEDDTAKIYCYLAKDVKEERRTAMLETLNSLNDRYKFLRLALDKDNDVSADYDFVIFGDEETACKQVISMVMLISDIMDHCVEDIMCTIWGKEN